MIVPEEEIWRGHCVEGKTSMNWRITSSDRIT